MSEPQQTQPRERGRPPRSEGSEVRLPHLHELHHLLWECHTLTLPLADEAFEGTELTLALSGTLDMIGAWPGSTAAELARRGPKSQQACSQLVSRLEKSGYVERRLGAGRGVELYLTAAGEAARSDGHRREDELEARLRAALGDALYAELTGALQSARTELVSEQCQQPSKPGREARSHDHI